MSGDKCSSEAYCEPLFNRCQAEKAGGVKGFVITKQGGLVYSAGRGEKGIPLSFCPFCGITLTAANLATKPRRERK